MARTGTSVYPASLDSFDRIGTANYEDEVGYDIVNIENEAMDGLEHIQSVIGTTAGTSILKGYAAGEFAEKTKQSTFGVFIYPHGTAALSAGNCLTYNGTSIVGSAFSASGTSLSFGTTVIPTGTGVPTTNQALTYDGTSIVGKMGWGGTASIGTVGYANYGTAYTTTTTNAILDAVNLKTSALNVLNGRLVCVSWAVSGLYTNSGTSSDVVLDMCQDGIGTLSSSGRVALSAVNVDPWCTIDGSRTYENTRLFYFTNVPVGTHYYYPTWGRAGTAGTPTIWGWAQQVVTAYELL